MNMDNPSNFRDEETPVDEVRRVRERLHRETGGDIHKLAERSQAAVEKFKDKLRLKPAPPPSSDSRRDGTGG
jgi:hypothetical protein